MTAREFKQKLIGFRVTLDDVKAFATKLEEDDVARTYLMSISGNRKSLSSLVQTLDEKAEDIVQSFNLVWEKVVNKKKS